MSAREAASNGSGSLADARLEAQNAVQWLARLAFSYAAPGGDALLRWDQGRSAVTTGELASGVTAELCLPALRLQFAEQNRPSAHPIDLDGKSSSEVEAWILVELLHRGFDRDRFATRLPYQWAHLMAGDEPKYMAETRAPALTELTTLYNQAASVIFETGQRADHESRSAAGDGDRNLICWPESFDIGIALPAAPGGPDDSRIEVRFTTGCETEVQPEYHTRYAGGRAGTPRIGRVAPDGLSATEIAARLADEVTLARRAAFD